MRDFETLVLSGATRHADTKGYGGGLKYESATRKETPPLIATDAINFSFGKTSEFDQRNVTREILKALMAFGVGTILQAPECDIAKYSMVSTGHWGCEVSHGTKLLKEILQWIAASEAGRGLSTLLFFWQMARRGDFRGFGKKHGAKMTLL